MVDVLRHSLSLKDHSQACVLDLMGERSVVQVHLGPPKCLHGTRLRAGDSGNYFRRSKIFLRAATFSSILSTAASMVPPFPTNRGLAWLPH